MNNNYFFGYGMLREEAVIREIIGHTPEGGQGAIIEDFDLAYQTIEQIPTKIADVLKKIWGHSFRAYTICSGKGVIAGKIWQLGEKDIEAIKNWEFVGAWREIITIKATIFNGNTLDVITAKALEDQEVEKFVDSINYDNSLNPQGKIKKYEELYQSFEIEKIRQQIRYFKQQTNKYQAY